MVSNDRDMSSSLFRDSSDHTIEEYPGEIEGEYLLGIDDSGGWYYNPSSETIRNYQLRGSPLELKLQISMDKNQIDSSFDSISEIAMDLVDRTVLGHSLVLATKLSESTHLSEPQAKVYSLRDVYGVGRTQTARILDKSPNTVDNQRKSAKRKAEQAKEFIQIIRDSTPKSPEE